MSTENKKQIKKSPENNKNVNEAMMADNKLVIQSPKLGEVKYCEDDLITLTSPMLGFPDLSDYLIISNTDYFPFLWLQSVEDPSVCFIMIEPEPFFKGYDPKINKREYKVLGAANTNEIKLFCIVVIPDNPQSATANLRAPLAVNFEKKVAKQIVLEDDKWDIQASMFTETDKNAG